MTRTRRDTAAMDELLALAERFPHRTLDAGEGLIVDGEPVDALFVLVSGRLKIEKDGVTVATVNERGACVGEMSLLLDVAATATVSASEPSTVAVIDQARTMLDDRSGLALALARLL